MNFKEIYSHTSAGPQREQLVYKTLAEQGKPTDLWPVTVNGPNNTKITYYITRDFLKHDGVYLPMTGTTAQKLADYFDMYLPTNTISDQVWQAATSKINVPALSGTGYQGKDKFYSPSEVVNSRISATDANIYFSDQINKIQSENQNGLIDIGGGVKWLTVPPSNNSLGLHGIRNTNGTPIQGGYGTMHPNYEDHTEYGTFVRLIDNKVDVTYSDGRKESMTMDNFIKSPLRSALYADNQDIRNGELSRYNLKRDKANLAQFDSQISKKPLEEDNVDKFLNDLSQQISTAGNNSINKLSQNIEIMDNIGKDPSIKNLNQYSIPGKPPEGFILLPSKENSKEIGTIAYKILHNSQLGDQIPFKIDEQLYMARSEPHFNPSKGWHRGITVYKQDSSEKTNSIQIRKKLLQRIEEQDIDSFLNQLEKDI